MTYILFWIALGLIAWALVGFPIVLLMRGLFRRPITKATITPHVSLVIVAHNEASTIETKLENVYALDYPADRLEVIVASDGSDDGTNELVANYAHRGLRLFTFPRSGKIPALNAAVAQAKGEILVFSDANSIYAPDALRSLVAPFADATVGAVGGDQRYVSGKRSRSPGGHVASFGERLYWNFDRLLKVTQSRAGNMTSATGAIHAIRRDLFLPVPLGVSDDFVISTRAIIKGYRLVFERSAVAYEMVAPTYRAEFNRKLRVIVRGLRGLWAVRELFNPWRHGFYAVQIFSHKLLRWSVCWLALLLFAASLSLYGAGGFYRWLAQAQLLFYGCALVAWALRNSAVTHYRAFKLLSVPLYLCLANYASLRAWLQLVGGKRVDVWDSKRSATAHAA
jgi:cellulose synthase/poly-beta-1,6-N-acetylglucosamine synthase-like glycosyltransferase